VQPSACSIHRPPISVLFDTDLSSKVAMLSHWRSAPPPCSGRPPGQKPDHPCQPCLKALSKRVNQITRVLISPASKRVQLSCLSEEIGNPITLEVSGVRRLRPAAYGQKHYVDLIVGAVGELQPNWCRIQ
jgi:hypothetical protein